LLGKKKLTERETLIHFRRERKKGQNLRLEGGKKTAKEGILQRGNKGGKSPELSRFKIQKRGEASQTEWFTIKKTKMRNSKKEKTARKRVAGDQFLKAPHPEPSRPQRRAGAERKRLLTGNDQQAIVAGRSSVKPTSRRPRVSEKPFEEKRCPATN